MKTINFELSKRLSEWGWLDNVETEYFYSWSDIERQEDTNIDPESYQCDYRTFNIRKWQLFWPKDNYYWKVNDSIETLTLSEAIEFLPYVITDNVVWRTTLKICKFDDCYYVWYYARWWGTNWETSAATLLQAIESMISFLLDNWLLEKSK